ncbi:MAG TPA: transcriptional regulator [Mycobacteriales bacterium]|nr:transcriptional regulator [Mycobacteriales bacterium]
MRRILLSPKWLVGHLFVLAVVLVMLRLGLWQWHRSQSSSGGIQNYAYAFQWPCFAVFSIVLWVKTIRLELVDPEEREAVAQTSRFAAKPLPEPAIRKERGVRIGITTQAEPDDDDVEVAAYNAYLARLNARVKGA